MPESNVFNIDCMEGMKDYPDKFFELAVVDIPYGIESKISKGGGSHTKSSVKFHQLYSENGKVWDKAVSPEYFFELQRVSVNQIIWGANYYNMPACRCFIIFDKPEMRIHTMSDCEYAWTSFDSPAKILTISRRWNVLGIHPTQKPVKLYERLLKNYAQPGNKILDTHLGSGSSRIAAYKMGFDFTGYEIDKEYFEAQEARFKKAIAQPLFDNTKSEQTKLL
jgi:site-specific DNA-methyltransferase (adenine-specific)